MKIKNTLALALLALGTTALIASAQDNSNDGPPGSDSKASERGGPGQHEPGPSAGGDRPAGPAAIGGDRVRYYGRAREAAPRPRRPRRRCPRIGRRARRLRVLATAAS